MTTEEIIQKRIGFLVTDIKRIEVAERFYLAKLKPLVEVAQIFYPKLQLTAFDGAGFNMRINIDRCYDLCNLFEFLEKNELECHSTHDYPEMKNRDYLFGCDLAKGISCTLRLAAYFSGETCDKVQIGTQPIYQMQCNVDTPSPQTEQTVSINSDDNDLPF